MSLLNLPLEIWSEILEGCDDDDVRTLSMTCWSLMISLQSNAYRSVVLTESAKSGASIKAIASGPRAQFIRSIEYSPRELLPVGGWDEEVRVSENDDPIALSDESREVLSSLHRFPRLVVFRVILDEWNIHDWPGAPICFCDFNFDSYHGSEDSEPWRKLLGDSFSALQRSAGAFHKLDIQNLPPIPFDPPYRAFGTDEWKKLLRKLTSLQITLGGMGDQGTGSLTIAHQEFLRYLFGKFSQIPCVEHLRLAGNRAGIIGSYHDRNPIQWQQLKIPSLRSFELIWSTMDTPLCAFLLHHCATLERIYLRRCMAESKSNWLDLFQGIVERNPTRLVEFTVLSYPIRNRTLYRSHSEWSLSQKELESRMGDGEDGDDVVDKRNRRFVVGGTCESYGQMQLADQSWDEDEDIDELDESDVVVWEKVEKLMKRNRTLAELPSY